MNELTGEFGVQRSAVDDGDLGRRAHERRRAAGPDFLGIGAQRSGTTWLYMALDRHPALWLPPVKELHYFDDPMRKHYSRHLRIRLMEAAGRTRPLSMWDMRYFLGRADDAWYCRLFEPGRRQGLLTGEVTPAYAILDVSAFRRIHALNPEVKLIFIMRDPIERSWSNIVQYVRKRGDYNRPSLEVALQRLQSADLRKRSNYLTTIERLECVFSRQQIYYGFFENLMQRPQAFVTDVLRFLDVAPGEVARILPDRPVNAAAGPQRPMPEFERALAAQHLPWVRKLCERFDGPPHGWRTRYEALLADGAAAS